MLKKTKYLKKEMGISFVIFFYESQLKHYCALNVHLKHFGKASVPTPPHTQTRLFEDNAVIFWHAP